MTNAEIMAVLRSDSLLNKARAVFASEYATIDQAGRQRRPPGPVEIRGMEIEATIRIAAALGVILTP